MPELSCQAQQQQQQQQQQGSATNPAFRCRVGVMSELGIHI
jgi:hypothetical protein